MINIRQAIPSRTVALAVALKILVLVACGAFAPILFAQPFRIEQAEITQDRLSVTFPSAANYYYVLWRGATPTDFSVPRDMVLGTNSDVGTLADADSVSNASSRFYRALRVPVSAPLDTDGDGIDDVWELRFRRPGAALNGADAIEDHTGNGQPDLQEYIAQLPPPIASFTTASTQFVETAGTISVEVRFSRSYSGTLKFQIGGTAIEGRDFQPGFNKPVGELFTGTVSVSGTSATIPLTLLTNDFVDIPRLLVLSLKQPAAANSYRLGALSTHTLTIAEGDRGVFGGVISFTNGVVIGPQAVKLALRSTANGGVAIFDTSGATFFERRPFAIPVYFPGPDEPGFVPLGSASGVLNSEALGRTVNWSLEFGQPALVVDTLTANVTLRLSGLSASQNGVVARGVLSANRLDIAP